VTRPPHGSGPADRGSAPGRPLRGRRAGRLPRPGPALESCLPAARMFAPMLRLKISRPLLGAVLLAAAAPLVSGQDSERPDQVFVRNPRTGAVTVLAGEVQSDGSENVVVLVRGKENKVQSDRVVRVEWGSAPPAFEDGLKYFERGLFEDAAAKFRVAAGDASARDVVQAAAQLHAAESLLAWGASDPVRFDEATGAAEPFLAEHAGHRLVARAQMVEARGLVLAGKPAEGGAKYREVFGHLSGGNVAAGYDATTCLRAGLLGARAMLRAEDTLAARELFAAIESAAAPVLSSLDAADARRAELTAIQDEARLGEGFAELTAGNSKAALAFFQNKLTSLNGGASDTMRSAGALGLGEALLAEGQVRRAEIEFARVSALDHTDRDRVARAQVLLARCAQKLLDKDFKKSSCTWLKAVVEHYGDTPSAAEARELIDSLGC